MRKNNFNKKNLLGGLKYKDLRRSEKIHMPAELELHKNLRQFFNRQF